MRNIHGEKGSSCYKQNKLQVKDEYNKRNRNNEPKIDDTYKRCITKTKENGRTAREVKMTVGGKDDAKNITRKTHANGDRNKTKLCAKTEYQ